MSQAPKIQYRLIYDGIELVPGTPLNHEVQNFNVWALPGGGSATTKELVTRADARGKRVQLLTIDGINRESQLLSKEETENDG